MGLILIFVKKGVDSAENTKWFEEWFDSDHYHLLYGHRNEQEAEAFTAAILSLLRLPPGALALDMACGRGRHSTSLFRKGLNVTGIDLSERNIAFAKQQEQEGLRFFVHDMRKPLCVNYYDLALNLFTSIGYFEREKEDEDVIKAAAMALKPGGYFVLDFMNAGKVMKELVEKEIKRTGGLDFDIEREAVNGIIRKRIRFVCEGEQHEYTEQVRALGLAEFRDFFRTAGLKTLHLFGDYGLGAYDENSSPRLILIAQKPVQP